MPNKGILIQIPTGSNKTYFIDRLPDKDKKKWLDGEKIIKKLGIRNKLQYWYNDEYIEKTTKINKILNQIINKGFNVFFSGNPLKIKTDVNIIPEMNQRWNNILKIKKRGGWTPNEGLFMEEQQSYEKAIHSTPIVINGDIPNIKTLKSFTEYINFKINNNIIYS